MSETPLVRAGGVFAKKIIRREQLSHGEPRDEALQKKERATLAKRTNYNYEKRQKEIKRAKKKQQKLEE